MKKYFIAAFFFAVGMAVYGEPSPEPDFNRNGRALEIFNNQIRRNQNDGEAYINRGNIYFALGDFERAFADYNKAIELDPMELAYVNRGNAYYMIKDYDKSIVDYTYAVTLAPNDNERAGNFYALSVVYAAKGDQEQAEKNLNEAIRLNPGYRSRGSIAERSASEDGFNLNEGNARYWTDILSSYRRALEILKNQIRRNQNDGEAYINRGNTYFALGDFERAFADYNKAIELDPMELAYVNRGNAYYMIKDYDKSIADYTYAITLAPNDNERASIFYALSVVYAGKGDQEQAEKNLNEAIRLNPGYRKRFEY